MTLEFNFNGIAKAEQGTKKVIVCEGYVGNKYFVKVYYYDTNYDNNSVPQCCKTPSSCKNRECAERMVNKFFSQE